MPRRSAHFEKSLTWREALVDIRLKLNEAVLPESEARWLVEEVAGADRYTGESWLDGFVTGRGKARLDQMVRQRLLGEPLQYVLGHWAFRTLDLFLDDRVLIPRPETETLVDHALNEFDRMAGHKERVLVADLGTGSGAIGFSIAAERKSAKVWCTDESDSALAVARANLTGLGRCANRVRLLQGYWFDALPKELEVSLDLIVSNPPYIGADERLPHGVKDWEPHQALIPGPRGTEDLELLIDLSPFWLRSGAALVLELDPRQAEGMADRARTVGLVDIGIHLDLADRERVLVARKAT